MTDKTGKIRNLLLLLLGIPGVLFSQQPSAPMALVNGEAVSAGEVEKAAAEDLQSLELHRVQFEVQFQRDRQSALEDALDRVVRNRLLDLEAKKRKLSVDDLIAIEVDGATKVPSDELIVAFYNANKSMIDGSLADNASRIRQYLREQQRQSAFDTFIAKLTGEYGVKSFFEPSRTPILLAGHPMKGPENAAVTIVEFADFECPYCGALFSTLQKIESDYKDKLNVVYYQFPLVSIHPHAQKAA